MCAETHWMQHHVPETYLKPWKHRKTSRSFYVDAYSRGGDYLGEKLAVNILRKEDYYTIYTTEGNRDLRYEHWFNEVETAYTEARDRILTSGFIAREIDLPALLLFISAQRHRTVKVVSRIVKGVELFKDLHDIGGHRRTMSFASGRQITLEEMNAWTGHTMTDIIVPEILEFARRISRMNVCLMTTKHPQGFWTCDDPVNIPYTVVRNIETPSFEVRLPISPTTCICLTWRTVRQKFELTGPELQRMNLGAQQAASELVIRKRVGSATEESSN